MITFKVFRFPLVTITSTHPLCLYAFALKKTAQQMSTKQTQRVTSCAAAHRQSVSYTTSYTADN